MNINVNPKYNYNTSFKATYIAPATVKKKNWLLGGYKNKEVAFVKLEQSSFLDKRLLKILEKKWRGNYLASTLTFFKNSYYDKLFSVYALTEQKKHLEELDSDKVLGFMAVMADKDCEFIEFLQTNPDYYNNPIALKQIKNAKFKHVGTGLLNALKSITKKDAIRLYPAFNAIPFYKKNGFVKEFSDYDGLICRLNGK